MKKGNAMCAANRGEGEECAHGLECQDGMFCSNDQFICTVQKEQGQECNHDSQCKSLNCDGAAGSSICKPPMVPRKILDLIHSP